MRILFSAFSAYSPYGSESLVGHQYARVLGRRNQLSVITCAPTDVTTDMPGVERVHTIDLGGRDFNEVTRASLLSFELRQWGPAALALRRGIDLIHRVNPCSINDPTLLAFFNRPLVVGPILASGNPPDSFREITWREIRHHKATAPLRERIQIGHRLGSLIFDPLLRSWTHLKKARRILVGSAKTMEEIPSHLQSRCEPIVYAGVEHDSFSPAPPGGGRGGSEAPKLLWVGRLKPHKGIELLLKACGAIRGRHDFTLTIIGRARPFFDGFLKDLIARQRLDDRVAFIPAVKREELPEIYRRHDVFCFPSVSDTYGVALLEAMSCGMPIVATDIGGPKEIVPVSAGVLVPVVSPEQCVSDIASALAGLIEDPARREAMGRAARARILERHDWGKIGARLEEIYNTLP